MENFISPPHLQTTFRRDFPNGKQGFCQTKNRRRPHLRSIPIEVSTCAKPLLKTCQTCRTTEVDFLSLSSRSENPSESNTHGSGIAAFQARCGLLPRSTRQRIVASRSSSSETSRPQQPQPLQSPAERRPVLSCRCQSAGMQMGSPMGERCFGFVVGKLRIRAHDPTAFADFFGGVGANGT